MRCQTLVINNKNINYEWPLKEKDSDLSFDMKLSFSLRNLGDMNSLLQTILQFNFIKYYRKKKRSDYNLHLPNIKIRGSSLIDVRQHQMLSVTIFFRNVIKFNFSTLKIVVK